MDEWVEKGFFIPKLIDLIDAVTMLSDDRFGSLSYLANGTWIATAWYDHYCGTGTTPEEAVANLWLELNKKDA